MCRLEITALISFWRIRKKIAQRVVTRDSDSCKAAVLRGRSDVIIRDQHSSYIPVRDENRQLQSSVRQ